MTVDQLQIVLLALLPADGTALSVDALAKATCTTRHQVAEALEGPVSAARVHHDLAGDSYAARKQGGAL